MTRRRIAFTLLISAGVVWLAIALARMRRDGTGTSPADVSLLHVSQIAELCKDYRAVTGSWPTDVSQISRVVPISSPAIFTDAWGHAIVLLANTNAPKTLMDRKLRSRRTSGRHWVQCRYLHRTALKACQQVSPWSPIASHTQRIGPMTQPGGAEGGQFICRRRPAGEASVKNIS
jgi:hypothetical protein